MSGCLGDEISDGESVKDILHFSNKKAWKTHLPSENKIYVMRIPINTVKISIMSFLNLINEQQKRPIVRKKNKLLKPTEKISEWN